jgi:hypothetical protein
MHLICLFYNESFLQKDLNNCNLKRAVPAYRPACLFDGIFFYVEIVASFSELYTTVNTYTKSMISIFNFETFLLPSSVQTLQNMEVVRGKMLSETIY